MEEDNIRWALLRCKYPQWALNRLHIKINHKFSTNQAYVPDNRQKTNNNNNKTKNHKNFLVVSYTKRLGDSFKKVCSKLGMQVHLRGHSTICTLLVALKDKDTTTKKSGVMYWLKYTQAGFKEEYIVESGRTFGDRLREHHRVPYPSINTPNLQDILLMCTAFPLWAGKHTVLLGPSRRSCTFESMNKHGTEQQTRIFSCLIFDYFSTIFYTF